MEIDKTLFSIIVPVYNVEKYLMECVDSIINQTYGNFELILVDDGSTDQSSTICDTYAEKDQRVVVIHKKNGGLVSARKAGLSLAKGDYAVCVDSDDWIAGNHLFELAKVIEAYTPDVICFNYYEINESESNIRRIPYKDGFYTKEKIEKEIYPQLIHTTKGGYFPPSVWAKVYKMDLYRPEQMSVDDKIKIGEDVACAIPCIAKAENLYILDKALYYYRRNNISMTKVKKPFSWEEPELIDVHLRSRLKGNAWDFSDQISRRTAHALISVVKTQFYGKNGFKKAKKEIMMQLKRKTYMNAINGSNFEILSATGVFFFLLRHRILFPFLCLSKFR